MRSTHANDATDDRPDPAGLGLQGSRKVPEALAIYRFIAGLSRQELASGAGVAEATIARLERGERRPQRRTAFAIAAVLGVPAAELFPRGITGLRPGDLQRNGRRP